MLLPGCAKLRTKLADRVGDVREHNRDRACSPPHRRHLRGASHEHLGPERKHLRYVTLEKYRVDAAKPAQRDTQITPFLPAERAEPLHQGGGIRMPHGVIWRSHQHAEAAHPVALLRTRRERPSGCRAAEQRDQLATLHSITSSAVASSLSGT